MAILGLGVDALVPLPTDEFGVVLGEQVAPTLDRVEGEGARVMAVAINACATGTGLHDPVAQTVKACRERGVWCHIDGAHGASALLSPRLRKRFEGVERADSMVWDAHKMLRTSVLCAGALFRDPASASSAFEQDPSYFSAVDQDVPVNLGGLGGQPDPRSDLAAIQLGVQPLRIISAFSDSLFAGLQLAAAPPVFNFNTLVRESSFFVPSYSANRDSYVRDALRTFAGQFNTEFESDFDNVVLSPYAHLEATLWDEVTVAAGLRPLPLIDVHQTAQAKKLPATRTVMFILCAGS